MSFHNTITNQIIFNCVLIDMTLIMLLREICSDFYMNNKTVFNNYVDFNKIIYKEM